MATKLARKAKNKSGSKVENEPVASSYAAFGAPSSQHFTNVIDGIYGTFATPAGKVCYMQTKAKVGSDGTKYALLTRSLVPAREALNIQEMDFNQLLQRDLDDHRIAIKLIPYILNPPGNSLPGFFPPIVALLLPFNNLQQPIEQFCKPTGDPAAKDHEYNMSFKMTTYGRACQIQYLVDDQSNLAELPFSVLRWNPDEAKLVIMDGQHRAMSLLAIERTVTNSWHTAPKGARYQPFYEEHVRKWLKKAEAEGHPVDLSQIELPVTICWFPDEPGQAMRPKPHRAARKLFVDVNNTAKPPSEARLVLLSDTELENILARELLNRLRRDAQWNSGFPLYGVEYDNPVKANTTPRRWSVVTNLEILKASVIRAVFGPPKLIENAKASFLGKPALKEMNAFMRKQLQVGKLFAKEFHDGPHRILREALSNQIFPIHDASLHQKLLDVFYTRWGRGILHLFSEIEPYKAHLSALNSRYIGWTPADNVQTLAKDALFEGVGMFWTIEDGHQLWADEKKDAQDNKLPLPIQTDISRAWTILEDTQRKLFQDLRAKTYLGSDSSEEVKDSERLYGGLITYAAQVGLVLAWTSIHSVAAKNENVDPDALAKAIALAINRALTGGPIKARNRKKIFLRESFLKGFVPLNELPKLEPAYAVYYRYFWLELLLISENHDALKAAGVNIKKAMDFLAECRRAYLELLIEERKKERLKDAGIKKLAEGKLQEDKAMKLARDEIKKSQAKAHQYWFGGKSADCDLLIAATLAKATTGNPDMDTEQDDGVSEEENEIGEDLSI